jgi:hypothetical protein
MDINAEQAPLSDNDVTMPLSELRKLLALAARRGRDAQMMDAWVIGHSGTIADSVIAEM